MGAFGRRSTAKQLSTTTYCTGTELLIALIVLLVLFWLLLVQKAINHNRQLAGEDLTTIFTRSRRQSSNFVFRSADHTYQDLLLLQPGGSQIWNIFNFRKTPSFLLFHGISVLFFLTFSSQTMLDMYFSNPSIPLQKKCSTIFLLTWSQCLQKLKKGQNNQDYTTKYSISPFQWKHDNGLVFSSNQEKIQNAK